MRLMAIRQARLEPLALSAPAARECLTGEGKGVKREKESSLNSGCTSAFARAGGGVKSSMGEFQILW